MSTDSAQSLAIDYSHLTDTQKFAMFMIIVITNICGIPQVIYVFKKGLPFQTLTFGMSLLCSFMYHTVQVFGGRMIMNEDQWHRVDNIFGITSCILFLMIISGVVHYQGLKYSALVLTIIIQEGYPFTLRRTLLPMIIMAIITALYRYYNPKNTHITHKKKQTTITWIFVALGIYCFFVGTNEKEDYLRIYHGLWHLCAGVFTYFGVRSVEFKGGWSQIHNEQIKF